MKALTNRELTYFCSQLALILRSGISPAEGLSLMMDDTSGKEGNELLKSLSDRLGEGAMLHEALSESGLFPEYMCAMTEIGENSGRLDEVMESLSSYFRREEDLSRNIRSAVTYPLVMLGMMLAVMAVLVLKVMPVFRQVFSQLGTEMTGLPGAVLELGASLSRYSFIFLILALIAVSVLIFFCFTKTGREKRASFSEHFFATRKLSEKIACSRFASAMYLSLSSGLDVDQSLEMSERLTGHTAVRSRIAQIRALTAEGAGFAEALGRSGLFPGIYAHMLAVGFRTGATDTVLKQISEQYEEEIEQQMESFVAKLEPTLVAFLSVVTGMILLSVMLPLMGIMTNIG